jgi:hypothetical protein
VPLTILKWTGGPPKEVKPRYQFSRMMFQSRPPRLAVLSLADLWIAIFGWPITARRIVRTYLLTGSLLMRWIPPVLRSNEIRIGRGKQMNRWRKCVFGQGVMDGLFHKRRAYTLIDYLKKTHFRGSGRQPMAHGPMQHVGVG